MSRGVENEGAEVGSDHLIRTAQLEDADALLRIYAPYVERSVISFELEVPTPEEFRARVKELLQTHPWLLCEIDGHVAGYAYASAHRNRPAYKWSVEVSVYVAAEYHRRGIARALYSNLFEELRARGFYNAYAGITLPNEPSSTFHRRLGFEPIGIYRRVGFKNGGWRDVEWLGLTLREHDVPSEEFRI